MPLATPQYPAESACTASSHEDAGAKTLRKIQKQNVAVLKAIPDLILIVDRHGKILSCNHSQAIYQLNIKDCAGNSIENFFPGQSALTLKEHIQKAFEAGTVQVFEDLCNVWQHLDRHCEFRMVAVDEEQALVIIRDITQRREAEQLLRESEAHLRSLMESASDFAVFRIASDRESAFHFRTVFASPSLKKILDVEDPHRYETWFEKIHPEDVERVLEANFALLKADPFDEVFRSYHARRGAYRWMRSVSRVANGRPGRDLHVNGLIMDITDQRKAETALRVEEERYRLLVESMNEGLVALNQKGNVTFVNEAFSRLAGRKRGKLLGRAIAHLIPKKGREIYADMAKGTKENDSRPFRVSFSGKKGRTSHALVSPRPFFDDTGKFKGSLSVYTDITELVETTQRLEKRERELGKKSKNLEESNIALKVLLKRKLADEDEIKNNVLQNVKELVKPYIEKIRETHLTRNQEAYLNILETNLEEIVSPFIRNLTSDYIRLTPQEIRIANYIRQGRTTKEIASLLNLSLRTIDAHRNSIRRKLGISKKRVNLQTFLQTMMTAQ